MVMKRQTYELSDTGTFGDTGPTFQGVIMQVRWAPTTDTGLGLQVSLIPKFGDTGDGWLIINETDVGRTDLVRVPRQPGHAADGTDTGVDQYFPIVAAGDHVRVKVLSKGASTATISGRLYVWTVEA